VRVLKVNCVNTLAAMRTLNVCMQAGAGKAERWQSLTVVRTNYQAKTLEKIGVSQQHSKAVSLARAGNWPLLLGFVLRIPACNQRPMDAKTCQPDQSKRPQPLCTQLTLPQATHSGGNEKLPKATSSGSISTEPVRSHSLNAMHFQHTWQQRTNHLQSHCCNVL